MPELVPVAALSEDQSVTDYASSAETKYQLPQREGLFMKVGLIRCMQTEDMCPATTCFKVINTKKLAFEGIEEDNEVARMNTCGGCPGKTPLQELLK